jgi:tetratricopeptide (TPR) repeat protein
MRFLDALARYPEIPIFERIDEDQSNSKNMHDWELNPVDAPVLLKSEVCDFFIVKAKQVLSDGTIRDCYIDISLPERINDSVYFLCENRIEREYPYKCDGEIICAVPIACFGIYELFYSRLAPDIGINVLLKGLAATPHQQFLAEDLAYILRDEQRFAEAATWFQFAADREPSSFFIFLELARCYEAIGNTKNAAKYMDLFHSKNVLPDSVDVPEV